MAAFHSATGCNGSFCDDIGMDDDELTDFLQAYSAVCAEAGIDPLATDALAAGVSLH